MFQRTGPSAYKDNLNNSFRLDTMFNHPHHAFKTIHVAGTNGKGSVSHMLASVLQASGIKTGLYTSPHLKDFRERIRVNGEMIPEEAVMAFTGEFIRKNKTERLEPSFFELTVSMAFNYFREQRVEVAVIEVGLGGRLDSTNIITPEVSVITNISFDHQALLGNSLPAIAAEKAGIIKSKVPVVIGESSAETNFVFEEFAVKAHAPLVFADQDYQIDYSMLSPDAKQLFFVRKNGVLVLDHLKIDLLGIYQRKNVCTVLKTIDILNQNGMMLTEDHIRKGLSETTGKTGLLGRWQIIGNNPLIVCDTGHNQAGIRMVVEQINNTAWKNLHFVIGVVKDKDPDEILNLLPRQANYYFTKASIPRAMDEQELKEKASKFGLAGSSYPSVRLAFDAAKAKAEPDDLVFVGGSTFVVAEIL
jgi:dihydrofolate synthase/folylpolyglutamate synthase